MKKLPFGLFAGKQSTDIRKQVADYADFLELFPVQQILNNSVLTDKLSRASTAGELWAEQICDFAGTVPDTLVFKVNIRMVSDGNTAKSSYLAVRIHGKFDAESFNEGRQKMTILKYVLDGEMQDLQAPVDLKTMIEYKKEFDHGYIPVMKSEQHPGWIPAYRRPPSKGLCIKC